MSATIACTGCGSADQLVGAYFVDRFKRATPAQACRRCGLVWPVLMSPQMAAEVLALRVEAGVLVEELAA